LDQTTSPGPSNVSSRWALGLLLVAMVVVSAVRWRLLDVPLERDEGEYAHAGALMLDGFAPYERAYNMKWPGIYAAYAGLMSVFGETHRGIHQGLLLVNLLTMLFVFLLGRATIDEWVGAVAAAIYGMFSLTPPVQGLFANAEHFVLLLALPGLLLLLKSGRSERILWLVPGALLLGCGLVVKQHGLFLAAFGGLVAMFGVRPHGVRPVLQRAGLFSLAVVTPYLLTCLGLWIAGVFDVFWFWTFDYARAYLGQVPWDVAPKLFLKTAGPLFLAASMAWVFALLGLISPIWFRPARRRGWFLTGLAAFSALSICPGLYFRGHYFVLLLPAAALLSAVGIRALAASVVHGTRPAGVTAVILVTSVLSCGQVLWSSRQYLFELTPTEVARATYGLNPFPESLVVADFIRNSTESTASIAVVGSEPQIYFYSKRPPASSYMYTYPLVEAQPFNRRMQDEFIREIEESQPQALVFVQFKSSWLASAEAPTRVFRWLSGYLRAFELALVVESGDSGARVHEGEALARFRDQTNEGLYVYLRR
jgi:hypothetical protein